MPPATGAIDKLCTYIKSQDWSTFVFFRAYCKLNLQIDNKLSVAGIRMRLTTSNGIWCAVLIPTILSLHTALYDVSNDYKVSTLCSLGLLFYSILFVTFLSVSSTFIVTRNFSGCLAAIFLSSILLCCILHQDIIQSLALSITYIISYRILLRHLIINYPKTFTLGEVFIVAQSIVLFSFGAIAKCNLVLNRNLVETTLFMFYIILGAVVLSLYLLPIPQRTFGNLIKITSAYSVLGLLILHTLCGCTYLMEISKFLVLYSYRIKLLTTWTFLVMLAIIDLIFRTRLGQKANTSNRKVFHFLASLVFFTGIIVDMELMRLAAAAGLPLLLFIEAIRKFEIKPISRHLQEAFDVYCDEKDCGYFAMSPIYLYTGLACPLILLPDNNMTLEMLSGVMSIGIGDSMASWVGSKYGVHKWPGTNRTFEGTLFNATSQMAVIYALDKYGILESRNLFLRSGFAAIISSIVEGFTDQVDNLVLPLVTILSYQLISFLA